MIQYDHPVKVYYKDVDQMGIVYYSRYFEYFEEARTELLNSIGLDVTSIENEGIQLPVIESHCEYSKGAKFVHCGHTMGVNDISFNLNDKGVMCSVGQDNVLQVWKEKSEFYVDEGEQEELKLPQKPNSAVKEVDEGAQKAATANDEPTMMGSGDEVGTEDLLMTLTTSFDGQIETLLINSPFPCKILELNGEVEDNPDLINDDAYADGWCMIVEPLTEFDEDQYLDMQEYIEMLNELP